MRIELVLEVVTPLFLGGAEQQPELRPASIRGVLRYWLRAALGGVIGYDGDALKELRRVEAAVFGETERGSVVVARLSQPMFTAANEFLLPHRNQGQANAVPVGQEFTLTLSLRPRTDVKALETAAWSALLWLTLGGIGRRSRRGAGSVRLKTVAMVPSGFPTDLTTTLNDAATTAADGEALAARISDVIEKARRAFSTFASASSLSPAGGLPSFSVIRSDTRVVVWTPGLTDLGDYNEILKRLMNKMHSCKTSLGNDFPLAFGGISPRRASPLHVTAHRLQNEWALVMTHLQAEIQNGQAGKPQKVKSFLDGLSPKWEAYPPTTTGGTTP